MCGIFIAFPFCFFLHTAGTMVSLKCMWDPSVPSVVSLSAVPVGHKCQPVLSASPSLCPVSQGLTLFTPGSFAVADSFTWRVHPGSSLPSSSSSFGLYLNIAIVWGRPGEGREQDEGINGGGVD